MTKPSFALFLSLSAVIALPISPANAAEDAAIALDQLDRTILAEPEYISDQPLYGLYVLDTNHQNSCLCSSRQIFRWLRVP